METVDLLIEPRWVLPIAPDNCLLENHAIIVKDSRIVAVIPAEQAKQLFYAQDYLELKNHVIMPGLINAHTHTPMNLFRGLADDLMLMDWLTNHIWPAEKALINKESVADGSRLAIAEMIRSGTTCFNDHYFFPKVTAQVAVEEGMRACIGLLIMSVPTQWAEQEDDYFNKALHLLENRVDDPLISWSMAPHAPYTVSDTSLKKLKVLAEQYDLPIHMHVHETKTEIEQSINEYGKRPLERLQSLGLLSPRFINVHMTQLTAAEMSLIKDTGSHVVHCPESNLKLASGFAPTTELLAAGVNVAIGTDGAASNNDLDMLGEMRTASMIAKGASGDPTSVPAKQVLEMATINGARALGLDKEIGSLEPGKYADMIAIDLSSFLTQPIYNPISHLVYAANRLQVSDVWVAGRRLLKHGEFTQLDIESVQKKAHHWAMQAMPYKAEVTSPTAV